MAVPGSAQSIIEAFLEEYGLGDLASWAWSLYVSSGAADVNEFTPQLRAELPKTASFQARFPAYNELLKQGKGITVDQYRSYEDQIDKARRFYGLPETFGSDDREYVKQIMLAGVSPDEYASRAQIARDNALMAPPEVKQALRDLYGVSDGDLTAYWMDPEKAMPVIQRRSAAAQIAGAALTNKVTIDRQQAERLDSLGVTLPAAQQGFQKVAEQRGITAGDYAVSEADLINAQFGNAEATTNVERAQRTRTGQFAQGGGAAEGQGGVAGLSRNSG